MLRQKRQPPLDRGREWVALDDVGFPDRDREAWRLRHAASQQAAQWRESARLFRTPRPRRKQMARLYMASGEPKLADT